MREEEDEVGRLVPPAHTHTHTHTNCIEYLIDIYPFLCCKLLLVHHMKATAERLLEGSKLHVRVLQGLVTFAFWVVIHENFFDLSINMSICAASNFILLANKQKDCLWYIKAGPYHMFYTTTRG